MAEPFTLTEEYIHRIAPDGAYLQTAQNLLRKGAMLNPQSGERGVVLQARCQGSRDKPYTVRVELREPDRPQIGCDCGSPRHPCKHALALLLLALQRPELLSPDAPAEPSQRLAMRVTRAKKRKDPEVQSATPRDVNEALEQTVRAEPEDDGPRLIYADWLEENGHPDRAEFIRVQIDLARAAQDDPGRNALAEREKQLWEAHQGEWLQGFPAHMLRRELRYHRGFFEELSGDPHVWVKHCEKLFRHHPIFRVRLTKDVSAYQLGLITVLPYMARIRVLVLAGCRLTEPVKTMQTLFGSPFFTGLRRIDLGGCALASREAALAADSAVLENVEELDLSHNEIGPKGVEALAASARLKNLRVLVLAGNPVTDAGGKSLARSPNLDRLSRLDLRGVELSDGVMGSLCDRFGERLVLK